MIPSSKNLVKLVNDDLKRKLDRHIEARGVAVILKIPDIFDKKTKKVKHQSFDDFETDIPTVIVKNDKTNFKDYLPDVESFMLLEKQGYEGFEPTTLQEFESLESGDDAIDWKGNFDRKTCYIKYDKILPQQTIIEINDFNIKMTIEKAEKKIQTTNIIRYTLRRS